MLTHESYEMGRRLPFCPKLLLCKVELSAISFALSHDPIRLCVSLSRELDALRPRTQPKWQPRTPGMALKVIHHYGDEVLKVYEA